jgi:hypothetical protein
MAASRASSAPIVRKPRTRIDSGNYHVPFPARFTVAERIRDEAAESDHFWLAIQLKNGLRVTFISAE